MESKEGILAKISPKVRLFVIVLCANINSLTIGLSSAWTSPMMPKLELQYEDSPLDFKIDNIQASWIFSLIAMGALIGALISGPITNRFGRKIAMGLASLMYIVSFLLMVFANAIGIIYAGRVFGGIGGGLTMSVLPVYFGEISTTETRGSTGSSMTLFMTLGMLYSFCIGPYSSYIVFQICCLVLPIISFGIIFYLPESPYYLVKRDKIEEAVRSLQKIRGQSPEDAEKEIIEIRYVTNRMSSSKKGRCWDCISNPGNRRALTITTGLIILQQLSGSVVFVINSQSIFMEANSGLDAAVSSIIVGLVQVVSSSALQLIIDSTKRRTLLRISASGMSFSQLLIGTFFYIKYTGDASNIRWIPIFCFIVFQLSFRLGFGPLPFTLIGEIVPPNLKALAGSITTLLCWTLGFLVSFFYPKFNAIGTHYLFWGFFILCMFALAFAQFIVIETHRKSLNEIQEILQQIK